MIPAALAFLRSPISRYVAIALAVILALWGVHHAGYRAGVKREQAAQAEAIAKAEKRALEAEKRAATITTRVEVRHAAAVEKIRTVTQTLIKEVEVAVPSDPTRANVPWGVVRLLDAAAIGVPSVPNPSGVSDADPSPVTDADLTRAWIANAETCRVNAETVMAWKSWAVDQAANYNAATGQKP